MKDYTVKALRLFNDAVEGKQRKAGDVFECTKERYEVLKKHNAVELLTGKDELIITNNIEETTEEVEQVVEEVQEEPKKKTTKAKKTNKK